MTHETVMIARTCEILHLMESIKLDPLELEKWIDVTFESTASNKRNNSYQGSSLLI
jgi:hypothetical protein